MEGTSNCVAWKDRMEALLDENGLLEYITIDVAKPQAYDSQNLAQWKKDVTKARKFILEVVWDNIVMNHHGKETCFAMWKELI